MNESADPRPPRSARFVLIDQSLRDHQGHHYSYAWSVASAARSLDYEAMIIASNRVDADVARDSESRSLPIRPWFSESWTESLNASSRPPQLLGRVMEHVASSLRSRPALYAALRTLYGGLKAEWLGRASAEEPPVGLFHSELLALLRSLELGPQDHVFIPTLSTPEASDCFRLVGRQEAGRMPRVHLLFRRDPGEIPVRYSSVGSFQRLLRSIEDSAPHRQVLRFYTDTTELSREYSRLSKIEFRTLPIPVRPVPDTVSSDVEPRRILITYFGDARNEKGFHLLPGLVATVAESPIADRVKFVIQAHPKGDRDEPGIAAAREALRHRLGPMLELLEQPLSDDEYTRRLIETDAIIIPYQTVSYRYRSSGVLAEALVAGKPVVVPHDTWMAREADESSSVRFRGRRQLFPAVCRLMSEYPRLRQAARDRRADWSKHHHALALVEALVCSETRQSSPQGAAVARTHSHGPTGVTTAS